MADNLQTIRNAAFRRVLKRREALCDQIAEMLQQETFHIPANRDAANDAFEPLRQFLTSREHASIAGNYIVDSAEQLSVQRAVNEIFEHQERAKP